MYSADIFYMGSNLITVSGPPASGTSTLCDHIRDELGGNIVSGGEIFYQLAEEHNMTPTEFSDLAEENPEYDKKIDGRIKSIIENHTNNETEYDTLIVDSRLSGWHAEDKADLRIYLKAPPSVRAQRIDSRDETAEDVEKREQSERKRYMDYYDIDISDLSIYDLVIDTSQFSPSQVADISLLAVANCEDVNSNYNSMFIHES